MTINATDFYMPSNFAFANLNRTSYLSCPTLIFTDSSVPSIAQLIPNPLDGVTQANVTAVIQLIETAQQYTSQLEANSVDILDNLTPVLIFASLDDAATQIYTTGQQILKEEQEERDEMIIGIVFGLFIAGYSAVGKSGMPQFE
jgi:hypothetical protein